MRPAPRSVGRPFVVVFGICVYVLPAAAQDRPAASPPGPAGADVVSEARGRHAVAAVKEDGAVVQKGDVVCELDAAALRHRLEVQTTLVEAAALRERGALAAREAAELAVAEYVEGTSKVERLAAQRDLARADARSRRAEARVAGLKDQTDKSDGAAAESVIAQLERQEAIFALELAKARLKALEKYSFDRTIKKLKGEAETARAEELTAQAAHRTALGDRGELEAEVGRCRIVAPAAGRVRHVQPLRAGSVVREGQTLLRIVDQE